MPLGYENWCEILSIQNTYPAQSGFFAKRFSSQDITNWYVMRMSVVNVCPDTSIEYFKMVENVVITADDLNMYVILKHLLGSGPNVYE